MDKVKKILREIGSALKGFGGVLRRVQYNSPVILTFTVLSFGALVWGELSNGWARDTFFSVYRSSPTNFLSYLRFFGYALGHVDFEHFLSNFLLILMAGPILEERYGSKKVLAMIAVTAFATGILHVALSDKTLLGASGIAFMLILLSSFANLKQGRIPLTMIFCVVVFVGYMIVLGNSPGGEKISQLGHVLGGLFGAGFGFWLNKDKLAGGNPVKNIDKEAEEEVTE